MKIRKTVDFTLDFGGWWTDCSAVLMGLFLFLRAVYYFGCADLLACSGGEIWLHLVFPLALSIGYIVLLRGIRLDAPVIYGGLGAFLCLLMIIWDFQSGSVAWGILGLIWYALAAAVFLATVLGYLPNRLFSLTAFFLPVLCRFFAYDLKHYLLDLRLIAFLPELSALCGLLAFSALVPALVGKKRPKPQK